MLRSFCDSIDNILNSALEIEIKLKKLRNLLKSSLSNKDFRLECVLRVLNTIEDCQQKEENWNAPPIFYNAQLGYSLRIIFWPCFYENNPHEHKTWGITGVLHNQLSINIYELLENPKRLKRKNTIIAEEGETGYLMPGCIHNVNNLSHDLSASFHIFNNVADINNPEENAIWYPAPRRHNLSKGLVDRALLICLSLVSAIKNEQAFAIINRIYCYSSISIKLAAIKFLYGFDKYIARSRFNELETFL